MNKMKLFVLALPFFLAVLINFSSAKEITVNRYFGDDPNEYYIHDDDGCNCNCDACKNCSSRSPGKDDWGYYEHRIMSNRDFSEFKQLIADRSFESTKMDMTKSVIDINYFSAEQVKEMLKWFSFESNMLEIAKYAFKRTVDPNNYYKLYNSFSFESSVTELANYIKNYR